MFVHLIFRFILRISLSWYVIYPMGDRQISLRFGFGWFVYRGV